MTKIEKAIAQMEICKRTSNLHVYGPAYDMAITALQEKQERERGCAYCDLSSGNVGETIENQGDNFLMIKTPEGVSFVADNKHFSLLRIKFCPMCGRNLEGKR